jgi:bifunctional ADP-heptose synthase (sugar kinase/adenylyltransferase)
MPGAGVDIVAVLNITTEWEMSMDDMKQAAMIIVDKLGPNDRLSIVSLENNAHRVTELTYMSGYGRDVARLKINELVLGNGKFLCAALREGAQVPHPPKYINFHDNTN